MFLYETLTGFFAQDDPLANPVTIGATPPRFGLIDFSEGRWSSLIEKLRELNGRVGDTSYKLIFFGRHGQGWHNVAEAKYGTQAWDDYWAMLYGDGELTWGPDPELTDLGKDQASRLNHLWKEELGAAIPPPEKLYCSPMTRAMQTNILTFEGVSTRRTLVVENCREEYGEHTCDKRNTRTYISDTFPQLDIDGDLTEDDQLWEAETRETAAHATARAKTVLDQIFRDDEHATFLSITAHGGIINGFLHALGRPNYLLPTGGVLPVIIKATKVV
ncbi:histidine phosphatase superfamily [Mycena alexandri]|uniref:Histidine phosphatase superfamily n=1 Tax=Mycena alexandri TaxID=1745969 RepID=A0AAD6THS6_9AGAR|nr:histidine phosphatase superfamily [Mycena alexandri]